MTSTPPANRAERLRLKARLQLSYKAADLLHNKQVALERERMRLQGHADRTSADWHQRLADAATWLLRARSLGASPELAELNTSNPSARVDIAWRTSMGVTYPGTVDCAPAPTPQLVSTAALAPAATAYQLALEAAAQHAAATAALGRIETELINTARRRRALEKRLQPRLESQLHSLDLALDERDRDGALRVQLANRQPDHTP